MAWRGSEWSGKARAVNSGKHLTGCLPKRIASHGMARLGEAGLGAAWHGKARHGLKTALCGFIEAA
jgi:hypothetical protein